MPTAPPPARLHRGTLAATVAIVAVVAAVVVGYCVWFSVPPDEAVFTACVGRDTAWVSRFVGPPTWVADAAEPVSWFYDRPVRTPYGRRAGAVITFRGGVCTAVAFGY